MPICILGCTSGHTGPEPKFSLNSGGVNISLGLAPKSDNMLRSRQDRAISECRGWQDHMVDHFLL